MSYVCFFFLCRYLSRTMAEGHAPRLRRPSQRPLRQGEQIPNEQGASRVSYVIAQQWGWKRCEPRTHRETGSASRRLAGRFRTQDELIGTGHTQRIQQYQIVANGKCGFWWVVVWWEINFCVCVEYENYEAEEYGGFGEEGWWVG